MTRESAADLQVSSTKHSVMPNLKLVTFIGPSPCNGKITCGLYIIATPIFADGATGNPGDRENENGRRHIGAGRAKTQSPGDHERNVC